MEKLKEITTPAIATKWVTLSSLEKYSFHEHLNEALKSTEKKIVKVIQKLEDKTNLLTNTLDQLVNSTNYIHAAAYAYEKKNERTGNIMLANRFRKEV